MMCLYAIQFDTGAIKVGTTSALATRISTHSTDARRFGVTISCVWRSVSVSEGFGVEREWLARIWGDERTGKFAEYIRDRDFDEIVKVAPLPAFYSQADREPYVHVSPPNGEIYLTAKDVRSTLGLDYGALERMVRDGQLHKVKLPAYSFSRFALSEIRPFMTQLEASPTNQMEAPK